jgi:hypothetical protein
MNAFNLVDGGTIRQCAGQFLVGGQHDTSGCTNAQTGPTIGDGIQRVLDREQFARATKRCQTKTVRRITHYFFCSFFCYFFCSSVLFEYYLL